MEYGTVVADPPWRFNNRTGKGSPEHRRLFRYRTMSIEEICAMGPEVLDLTAERSHLYLWVPTCMIHLGLVAMASWGFEHKTNLYWHKVTRDGRSDRSCMGFYYRNVVEPCLFGVRGRLRTAYQNVPSLIAEPKREHSRKPEAFYEVVERQSPGPFLDLFARHPRPGWDAWGDQVEAAVLLTTDPRAVGSWREVVADVLCGGQKDLGAIYAAAEGYAKVAEAKALGHKWRAQIRRTLHRHFEQSGFAVWRPA